MYDIKQLPKLLNIRYSSTSVITHRINLAYELPPIMYSKTVRGGTFWNQYETLDNAQPCPSINSEHGYVELSCQQPATAIQHTENDGRGS